MEKISINVRYISMLLIFLSVSVFAQDVWDPSSWLFRRDLLISNPGATALTDFQVKVELNNTNFDFSYPKPDGSDIRIADNDGSTLLPFWVEEWDNDQAHAVIWVKIPDIPASGTTIYLYYGNTNALSVSNGTSTFNFFDDFSTGSTGLWGAETPTHNWKSSLELLHGALDYAYFSRGYEGHHPETIIEDEIFEELSYIHNHINASGEIDNPDDSLTAQPEYCYGLLLTNLAFGYYHFFGSDIAVWKNFAIDSLYPDMIKVYDFLSKEYPAIPSPYPANDHEGYSMLLVGFSYAWQSLDYGTKKDSALSLVQSYASSIIASQNLDRSWNEAQGLQGQLKRNLGLLYAHIIAHEDPDYLLPAVENNLNYILENYQDDTYKGLKEDNSFSDYNQELFMVVTRRLNGQSGGKYNLTDKGKEVWDFLTGNNPAGVDLYIDNYLNNNNFFAYSDADINGTYQNSDLKGAADIGVELWALGLNYEHWNLFDYKSPNSLQSYNYLDMLIKQVKKTPAAGGFFSSDNKYFTDKLNWTSSLTLQPKNALWSKTGTPIVSITQDDGNNVASFEGDGSITNYLITAPSSFDNFVLEMNVKMTADANDDCTPEVGFRVTDSNNRYVTRLRGGAQNDLFITRYEDGSPTDPGSFTTVNYNANEYYKYKIVANGTSIQQYLNDLQIGTTWNDAGSGIPSGRISLNNLGGATTHPVYFDDVRVRNFADQEPEITVGAHNNNPLPVELSSFSALIVGSSVKLVWKTETEVNNYGFEILRQTKNEKEWSMIGFVNGNGNSNSPKNYAFEDKDLVPGKYSYRLKQIDIGGQYEYSKTVQIDFNTPKEFALNQNYPNPFNPSTKITFSLAVDSKVSLKVFNILGQEVTTLVNEQLTAGNQEVNFNASSLNSGVYFYRIDAAGIDGQKFSSVKKMILTK